MIEPQDFEQKREALALTAINLVFISILIALVFYFWSEPAKAGELSPTESFVSNFLQNYPSRKQKALELVPVIESEAEKAGFDPLLIAVMISLESSFKTSAVGGIGEVGVMQVVPGGVCAKGFDLSKPDEQIKAGVNCLRMGRDVCGNDLTRILTVYASGRCVSKSRRTQAMIKHRIAVYNKAKGTE
jgi:hypothetical protein